MLSNDVTVEVYASNIPPSIRACVIYEQGRPIWGAMQSYRFEKRNDGGLSLQKPSRSLIAVCGDTSYLEKKRLYRRQKLQLLIN